MLTWLIKKRIAAFETKYGYDTSYLRDLAETDLRAFFKFARAASIANYRRDIPLEALHAVRLAAIVAEDCGPCTQLCVAFALEDGIAPRTIAAVLAGDERAMPELAHLGYRFVRAVNARDAAVDELREEIVRRWGKRALVAVGLQMVNARIYPTLKYALGYGKACERVIVAGEPVTVAHAA